MKKLQKPWAKPQAAVARLHTAMPVASITLRDLESAIRASGNPTTAKKITVATKSNGISISMPWWDKRADEMAARYPDVKMDRQHIDILCARFVLNPDRFDVVVASNLFGDILSDLGPACTGTIGIAPSGNLNPDRRFPSLFEPVHGSAPDIAGKGIANPVAMIWSAAMMLDFLGNGEGVERDAHDAIVAAITQVRKIESLDELDAMQAEADEILRETLDCYDDGAIEEADLAAYSLVLGQFHHAVADRRAAISNAPVNLARARAS